MSDVRDSVIVTRVSAQERAAIESAAKKAGVTVGHYGRASMLAAAAADGFVPRRPKGWEPKIPRKRTAR